jgi:hypothetical protein
MSEDDDRETVWIATNAASSSTSSFHTRECIHCPDEANRTTRDRDLMESWGYSECTYCAEEHLTIDRQDQDDDEDRSQQASLRARVNDPDDPIQELVSDD